MITPWPPEMTPVISQTDPLPSGEVDVLPLQGHNFTAPRTEHCRHPDVEPGVFTPVFMIMDLEGVGTAKGAPDARIRIVEDRILSEEGAPFR